MALQTITSNQCLITSTFFKPILHAAMAELRPAMMVQVVVRLTVIRVRLAAKILRTQRYQLYIPLDNEHTKFFGTTLIVCGRQGESVGYRDSLRSLEFYPRSTYVVLDRGGHDLPVDHASDFENLVHDWIIRVYEWRGRTNR
jgi:pimeloyl-ACP methyl ester carboxylesterase